MPGRGRVIHICNGGCRFCDRKSPSDSTQLEPLHSSHLVPPPDRCTRCMVKDRQGLQARSFRGWDESSGICL